MLRFVWCVDLQKRSSPKIASVYSLQIAELLARAGLWQPYQDFMKDRQDARQRGRDSK